jgi:hypothetical protein
MIERGLKKAKLPVNYTTVSFVTRSVLNSVPNRGLDVEDLQELVDLAINVLWERSLVLN